MSRSQLKAPGSVGGYLLCLLALALTACGNDGADRSPPPKVLLVANPTSVTSGGFSMLTWSSTDATSCLASGAWSGPKSTSDNQSTGALTTSRSYALNCIGSGGSARASATVTVTPTGAHSYTTSFLLTENPISESGMWINGKAVGLDWNNVQTVPGKASAANFTGSPGRYSDPIAHLNTVFTANQYAQGTVSRVAGYSPPDGHEIELLLRFQITAHNARGYEVLWAHNGGLAIVRWNGPLGNYTPLVDGLKIGQAVDGDVLRAEIVGNVIRVYKNGALVATGPTDTTWTNGQPGIGFWPLRGATLQSYGWKNFQAGSL